MIPFTTEQFLNVFEQYNRAVWPAQLLLYALALCAVVLTFRRSPTSNRLVNGILSFFWLWSGVVYHWLYFSKLNRLAVLLGALFVLQSLLLFFNGILKQTLTFRLKANLYGLGWVVLSKGHQYPSTPRSSSHLRVNLSQLFFKLWAKAEP